MNYQEGFLIALCGLPSSGKSYFARHLKGKLENIKDNSLEVVIIDPDKIRTEIFGKVFDPTKETEVRDIFYKKTTDNLKNNKIVIADDINYYTSMRSVLKNAAVNLGKKYLLIYINTPLNKCKKWNETRNASIPNTLIEDIASRFETPGKKYKWDRPFYQIDFSKENIDTYIEQFMENLNNLDEKMRNMHRMEEVSDKTLETKNIELYSRKILSLIRIIGNKSSDIKKLRNKEEFIHFFNKNKLEINEIMNKIAEIFAGDKDLIKLICQISNMYKNNIQKLNNLRKKFVKSSESKKLKDKDFKEILILFLAFIEKHY
jgi:O-phosphoseryl-tRNA(Sec) kinase